MQRRFRGSTDEIQGETQTEFSFAGGYGISGGGSLRRTPNEELSRKIVSGNRAHDLLDWTERENPQDLGQCHAERPCGGNSDRHRSGLIYRDTLKDSPSCSIRALSIRRVPPTNAASRT